MEEGPINSSLESSNYYNLDGYYDLYTHIEFINAAMNAYNMMKNYAITRLQNENYPIEALEGDFHRDIRYNAKNYRQSHDIIEGSYYLACRAVYFLSPSIYILVDQFLSDQECP